MSNINHQNLGREGTHIHLLFRILALNGDPGPNHHHESEQAMSTYEHCNPTMLLEVVGNDKEVFLELVDIFLSDSLEKLKEMEAAVQAQDAGKLEYTSHSLKGTVSPLGAEALTQMLQDIETESCKFQRLCSSERLAQVSDELHLTRQEVMRFVADGNY